MWSANKQDPLTEISAVAKSLLVLLEALLADAGRKCGAPIERDLKTARVRVEHEGDSFLTITLPLFCSAIETSLELGEIDASLFRGFRMSGRRPAFLQAFVANVFGPDGRVLSEPSGKHLGAIRQICLFFKKVVSDCSGPRKRAAIASFKQCELEVSDSTHPLFEDVARIVMADVISHDWYERLVPAHGPGVVVDRLTGNRKFDLPNYSVRAEVAFPYAEFCCGSQLHGLDDCSPNFHEPLDEPPVKVVFVPKTAKTPRVIAVEPSWNQWLQQGLYRYLKPRIERGRYTGGKVNFTDQSINQELARSSSVDRRFATLDMKEASDRVSLSHVNALLSVAPEFRDAVMAVRSSRARLPDGEILSLRKFASMGSALCFPMEALVFFVAIVSSRLRRANTPVSSRSVTLMSRDVYVYGDDLIVPVGEAPTICEDLEAMGLRVNRRKSFWRSSFRESCGEDWFAGTRVTPVYLRHSPVDRVSPQGIVSLVATSNQLFDAGYFRTCDLVRGKVESTVGRLPTLPHTSPGVGWTFFSGYVPPSRFNSALQRREIRCLVPRVKRQPSPLQGDKALLKCLVSRSDDRPVEHLETSEVRRSLTLKTSWVQA